MTSISYMSKTIFFRTFLSTSIYIYNPNNMTMFSLIKITTFFQTQKILEITINLTK